MTSDAVDEDRLRRCFAVFSDGDDAEAARQAEQWLRDARPVPFQLAQVLLISLQRIGAGESVATFGRQMLVAWRGRRWESGLLRLTLGQLNEAKVFAQASSARRRRQAYYYAAEYQLTRGHVERATRHLEAAAAGTEVTWERSFALAALGRLVVAHARRTSARAIEQWNAGLRATAIPLAQQALTMIRDRLGEEHTAYIEALMTLQALRVAGGQQDEVERIGRRRIALCERVHGEGHQNTALACNDFGLFLRNHGRPVEAAAQHRRALAIDEAARGPRHPKIAHRLNNLAFDLVLAGDVASAMPLLARAWRLKAWGHDLTSARILWVRIVAALIASESPATFLGILKSILLRPELAALGDVTQRWEVEPTFPWLRSMLAPGEASLVIDLASALNDRSHLPAVDRHSPWRGQAALSSHAPWPGISGEGQRSAGWQSRAVFISSTFADMQAERDHLRDHVFPILAERLRSRRHYLEPIDLRWGVEVTDHEGREREIVKVCLDEIERSRPFLIGLLGDRYGWVPAPERLRAVSRESGVRIRAGKSVTALELEYGLLSPSAVNNRSYVYLRRPLRYDAMPQAVAARFSLAHDPTPGAAQMAKRLSALKGAIRKGLPDRVREYSARWNARRGRVDGLDAWGRQVLDDLWRDLDEETRAFVDTVPPTPHEEDRWALEEFVEEHARSFVGRGEFRETLRRRAFGPDAEPWGTCVVGLPGAGKSALFAWLQRTLAADDVLLLAHAAGVGPRGGDVDAMLRRWCSELADTLGITDPTHTIVEANRLADVFLDLLARAAVAQRVVLLVDALDQFESTPRGVNVRWLPSPLPANVRFIATTIAGSESVALTERGVLLEKLPPLEEEEARDIVGTTCARYHRTLSADVLGTLLHKCLRNRRPACGNPLWLELALEELHLLDADDFARVERARGERYDEKLRRMMVRLVRELPPEVHDLYGKLLARAEKRHGVAWARAFAALIAVSRHGWRESDLRVLVPGVAPLFGRTGKTWLADLQLASLRRGFRAHLRARGSMGQWDFVHQQMRAAVRMRILERPQTRKMVHRAITEHLQALPVDDPLRESELMVHLIAARDLGRAARFYAGDLTPRELAGATRALARFADGDSKMIVRAAMITAMLSMPVLSEQERRMLCKRFTFELIAELTLVTELRIQRVVLEKARDTLSELRRANPKDLELQHELVVAQWKLASVLYQQQDPSALTAIRASLAIANRLMTDRTDPRWLAELADGASLLSHVLREKGDVDGSVAAARAGDDAAGRYAAQHPDDWTAQRRIAMAKIALSLALLFTDDDAGTTEAYHAARVILERLVLAQPKEQELQATLAEVYLTGSHFGDGPDADAVDKAYPVVAQLATTQPRNFRYQRLKLQYLVTRAMQLEKQGRSDEALAGFRAACTQALEISTRDPSNSLVPRMHTIAEDGIASILEARGDLDGARAAHERAKTILDRAAPGDAVATVLRQIADENLERLALPDAPREVSTSGPTEPAPAIRRRPRAVVTCPDCRTRYRLPPRTGRARAGLRCFRCGCIFDRGSSDVRPRRRRP